MRIRFLKDYKVQDKEGKVYKKDEVYDLSEPSANHFLNRNLAEVVKDEPKPAKAS